MSRGAIGATVWGFATLLIAAGCHEAPAHVPLTDSELVEVLSVGVLDGDEREVFGEIVEVGSAADGSFLVLDRQAATLGWFDMIGAYRGGVRSRGAGPGELAGPTALGVSSSGRVVVLDPPNGRYSFYDLDAGGLAYVGSSREMPSARGSICSAEGRFFLRSAHEGSLIHEFDEGGRILNSFSPVQRVDETEFGPATAMVEAQINDGLVSCVEEESLIVSVDTYLPYVRAFSLDGDLLWEAELSEFRPMAFVPVPEGGVRFETDPEAGSHLGRSIVHWMEGSLLVQHTLTWPQGVSVDDRDREFFGIESRELSIRTGEQLGSTDGLPLVVDEQEGRFYSYRNHPYPAARVLERRR